MKEIESKNKNGNKNNKAESYMKDCYYLENNKIYPKENFFKQKIDDRIQETRSIEQKCENREESFNNLKEYIKSKKNIENYPLFNFISYSKYFE